MSPNGWRNRLLAGLSHADRTLLDPHVEMVSLDVGQVLQDIGNRIARVHFIESGVVSIVGRTKPNHRIEVGMVGFEGMTGPGVVLGNDRAANEIIVQTSGWALQIAAPSLRYVMQNSPRLASTLLTYVYTVTVQASQTALANGRARLDERLARWLLMWHDRARTHEFTVTHEFLARLLGVRRQAVTNTLHELEGNGLIRSLRGRIRIVDRAGLLHAAGGFYGAAEREYERSIGCPLSKAACGTGFANAEDPVRMRYAASGNITVE
jgi:CRP-like cAMP-binding protein